MTGILVVTDQELRDLVRYLVCPRVENQLMSGEPGAVILACCRCAEPVWVSKPGAQSIGGHGRGRYRPMCAQCARWATTRFPMMTEIPPWTAALAASLGLLTELEHDTLKVNTGRMTATEHFDKVTGGRFG